MHLTRLVLAGVMALGLTACHKPEHRICDGDKVQRTTCILLIVGAVKAVKLVALSSHHGAAAD